MTVLFWLLVGLILYSLLGYGLLWIALAAVRGQGASPQGAVAAAPLHATMLIAARNEEASIAAKLQGVLSQDVHPHRVDIVVVSDGSEDATMSEVARVASPRVTAMEAASHGGKAQALNLGLSRVTGDVVIFSDANSMLVPGALRALLEPFADPVVGGTCGQPRPARRQKAKQKAPWLGRVERAFWLYDSALKRAESRLAGAVSAQGTLYAIRRACLPRRVPEAFADDFYISVQVPAQGRRLAFVSDAIAEEEVTDRTGDEFMRRVRSTERGWRALVAMRGLLNPARHGLYAVQLFSHKVLRRLVAFALPVLLIVTFALLDDGPVYVAAFAAQIFVYGVGVAALLSRRVRKLPGASHAAFFLMGHLAMALGILRATAGVQSARWSPVRDRTG